MKSPICELYLPLNEGQGNPHDSSGNGNNATNYGADWISGDFGYALDFNGTGDYVKIADNFLADVTAFTMIGWYKHEAGGGTYETIIHKSNDESIGGSDFWMGVCIDNYLCATIGANVGGIGWIAGKTTTVAVDGTWYNMAATWDGAVVRVYKNGVYNKQYNLTSYNNITTPTRFGASNDGIQYRFKGSIGAVLLYTSCLTVTELLAFFNNTKAGYGL